mmetsp:Transcript_22889/g.34101  ORF Transcript_22889/g.34101 Transcript_22889/m.34101 type:complete len:111 (-) Transcript_22889:250-582(-)
MMRPRHVDCLDIPNASWMIRSVQVFLLLLFPQSCLERMLPVMRVALPTKEKEKEKKKEGKKKEEEEGKRELYYDSEISRKMYVERTVPRYRTEKTLSLASCPLTTIVSPS